MSVLSADQRETHLTTSKQLFAKIQQVRELENGYEFQFAGETDLIVTLAEFISLEKLCCPFLNFVMEVEREGGPVRLRLTGREGVKAFVREEIDGLLGVAIDWKET